MQGTKNLTKGPINRQLFNLAMPIMATSFIQMAYSLTDMAWVGRIGILRIFELKEHITENAVTYLRIVSTGLPFVFLSAAFTGIYNAAGRSKTPFYISGTGLIMNIILDPLFIFGFGWGTVGAALATWLAIRTIC